jgi:hypothetical protein
MFLANQRFILSFFPLLPLTEVSPQPSAIPGGNPPGDWYSAVGCWGDGGFEPGTAEQQSGALPLSRHECIILHPIRIRLDVNSGSESGWQKIRIWLNLDPKYFTYGIVVHGKRFIRYNSRIQENIIKS